MFLTVVVGSKARIETRIKSTKSLKLGPFKNTTIVPTLVPTLTGEPKPCVLHESLLTVTIFYPSGCPTPEYCMPEMDGDCRAHCHTECGPEEMICPGGNDWDGNKFMTWNV